MTYTIRENPEHSGREVYFDAKPSDAVRTALKNLKLRWHSVKKCWYGKVEEYKIIDAIQSHSKEEEHAVIVTDGYMGGGAVYGSKSHKRLHGTELAKAFREDFKAAGIKGATVRCERSTYTDSFEITVKARTEDFLSLEDFCSQYQPKGHWIYYGNSAAECISWNDWFSLPADEKRRIKNLAAKRVYEQRTTRTWNSNAQYGREDDAVTADFRKKLEQIVSIVAAYRYDASNSMVDYYETNFYYSVTVKPEGALY